jgi:phosphoglycolate phosphatase-like HAD superfamily hydrolase
MWVRRVRGGVAGQAGRRTRAKRVVGATRERAGGAQRRHAASSACVDNPHQASSRRTLALDLDGTLVDAKPRQVAALVELLRLERMVERVDADAFWELKRAGLTTKGALGHFGFDPAAAERLGDLWAASVEDRCYLHLDRLIPGVQHALEALEAAGCRPVVLTARQHRERTIEAVASLGLLRWCAEVRVVPPRSAAEAKAAELIALDCAGLIGDTESDARAAELAGIPFVAVTTGQRSEEFLKEQQLATSGSLPEALRALGREWSG